MNSRKAFQFFIVLVILLLGIPCRASIPATNMDESIEEEIRSGALEQFIDDTFAAGMDAYGIPGGVISIVKDGHIVLSKGYGYADMDKKKPIDQEQTLFRIGSITKLFTADAVMQLKEKGKIDLNEDINQYIHGFQVKNAYPVDVTTAQLLTHTSGIDSDSIGDLSKRDFRAKTVSDFLQERMLPVVREPGRFIQYSSYGIALAGCIVENISDMECADYIEQNIFNPLGMTNTTFQLNPAGLAQGYISVNGTNDPRELEGYFNLYPVGGIASTADDMAKYMIAHLDGGACGERRILHEETTAEMLERHAGFDPLLPGTCYGFYEGFSNGWRTVGHGGYAPDGFSAELRLFPEYHMGVFIAVNQGSNNMFPQDFLDDVIDFFGKNDCAPSAENTGSEGVEKGISGIYRFGEYTRSTLNKGDIFGNGEDVTVTVNPDKTITLNEIDPFTRQMVTSVAVPVSPMVFSKTDGGYVVFRKDARGRIAYMAQSSDSWHGTYERIRWYEGNTVQTAFFIGSMCIFVFELLLSFVLWIKRLLTRKPVPTLVGRTRLLTVLTALLNVTFFSVSMMTWGARLRYGMPLDAKLLLTLPLAASALVAILAVFSIILWRKREGTLFFRINTSIVSLIGLLFIWVYQYYNLLGFRY